MKKSILLVLSAFVVLAVVLSGCTTNQPIQETVKIGVIFPLTGKTADYGNNALDGLKLAEKKIKADPVFAKDNFELLIDDDGSNVNNSLNSFQKQRDFNQVTKFIGPIGSSNVKAVAPLTDNTDILLISPLVGAEDATLGHPNVFRIWPTKSMQLVPMFKKVEREGYKRIAIISANNDSSLSARDLFRKYFKDSANVKIVYDETVVEDEKDFKTSLLKVKNSGADALFLNIYMGQFTNALKEKVNLNINLPIFTTATFDNQQDQVASGATAEGLWYTAKNVAENWFIDLFKAEYGREPNQEAATAYDALMVYAQAIVKVGNNNALIRDELIKMKDYPGASGTWQFDENRNVPLTTQIKQIKNGVPVVVE